MNENCEFFRQQKFVDRWVILFLNKFDIVADIADLALR